MLLTIVGVETVVVVDVVTLTVVGVGAEVIEVVDIDKALVHSAD